MQWKRSGVPISWQTKKTGTKHGRRPAALRLLRGQLFVEPNLDQRLASLVSQIVGSAGEFVGRLVRDSPCDSWANQFIGPAQFHRPPRLRTTVRAGRRGAGRYSSPCRELFGSSSFLVNSRLPHDGFRDNTATHKAPIAAWRMTTGHKRIPTGGDWIPVAPRTSTTPRL
jgi:hypothetical protein